MAREQGEHRISHEDQVAQRDGDRLGILDGILIATVLDVDNHRALLRDKRLRLAHGQYVFGSHLRRLLADQLPEAARSSSLTKTKAGCERHT